MASDDEFRQQLDLFIPFIAELSLRDQRETMERPFFSLSKGRRLKPIEYRSPDGSIWIDVLPHPRFGMATIWDADILIWAISMRRSVKMPRVRRATPGCAASGSHPEFSGSRMTGSL